MDDLKAKVKSLRLNPFKKTPAAFKGTGRVLGGGEASTSKSPNGSAGNANGIPQDTGGRGTRTLGAGTGLQDCYGVPPIGSKSLASTIMQGETSKPFTQLSTVGQSSGSPQHPHHQQDGSALVTEVQSLQCSDLDAVDAAVGQLASQPEGRTAAHVLQRLLHNIVAQPSDAKFRRLRLSNPKIQAAVVDISGGVELLLACGFDILFEDPKEECGQTEGFAVLDAAAALAPLEHALALLRRLCDSTAVQAGEGPGSTEAAPGTHAVQPSSSNDSRLPGGQAACEAVPAPQQQARGAQPWEPPRPRATRVLLPTSPATDLPSWFFDRTGSEVKSAIMSAARRREQDQVLMTRAMRDRLRGPASGPAPTFALIRVRLPEGICLQGEFGLGEPVSAIHAWVSECLRDPGCTYELILPPRKVLEVRGQAVRAVPELLPAATLNFRWTGRSALEMRGVPALRNELLREAQA